MRNRVRAAGLLVALAALTACGTASRPGAVKVAGPGANQAAAVVSVIKTRHTNVGTVLTTSRGATVYWFAADTATASRCTGGCAQFFPPVEGPAAGAPGASLPGKFGTLTRPGGFVQATYDGHPLYTSTADTEPGQTDSNMDAANGGLWWAMTPSAARLGAPAASGPTHSMSPAPKPSTAKGSAPPPSTPPGGYGY